jgi:hypothetical protein
MLRASPQNGPGQRIRRSAVEAKEEIIFSPEFSPRRAKGARQFIGS